MPKDSNNLGSRGESAVATCLLRPLGDSNTVQFRPFFLGEKAELLDFLVLLVNKDDQALGPHFFLQVKATAGNTNNGSSIKAIFTADEVARVQKWKAPTYIAAIDASKPDQESIYIRSIKSDRKKGISSVSTKSSLNDPALRQRIYKEIVKHFQSRVYNFTTSTC